MDNTPGDATVDVTAASSLSADAADSKAVAVNLSPGSYDVDLGNPTGAPLYFECDSSGEFELPVRINTGGAPLTAFQILIEFDSDIVLASAAEAATAAGSMGAILPPFLESVLSVSPGRTNLPVW